MINHSAAILCTAALLALCSSSPSFAFVPSRHRPYHQTCASSSSLSSNAIDDITSVTATSVSTDGGNGGPAPILQSRNRLLALSTTLAANSTSGKFISRPSDKIKLQKAINELEGLASTTSQRERELLLGDWTLLATASLPSSDIRRRFGSKGDNNKNEKKNGWFNKQRRSGQSSNPIKKSLQKSVAVTQRIRNDGNSPEKSAGQINRVDNVIEFTPLDTLEGIIPENSPLKFLGSLNINPLQVKKGKVVLVHKAEVESVAPVLRTKICLTSTILNVSGTSPKKQSSILGLDPNGEDIFGVNSLVGGAGTFDTPFVDNDIRVSRTSGPVSEQLRVFIRSGSSLLDDEVMMDSFAAELRVEEEKKAVESESSDVGTKLKKVVDATTSLAENARETIEKDMDSINKALSESMDDVAAKVQDAVEDDLEQIGKAMEGVRTAMQGGEGDVVEAIANVTKAVAKVSTDVRDIVEEDATELGDKVEEALDTMVADVQDVVESDLKDVGKSLEEARNATTGSLDSSDDGEMDDEGAKE